MNTDAQFGNLSCPIGGLRLNGNITQGTALSSSVITIDDPGVISNPLVNPSGYFKVVIGGVDYFVPVYR